LQAADKYHMPLIYGGGAIFIIANSILMLAGFYYFPLLPLFLLLFYLAFFRLDKLFMAVVFLTPLSLELSTFAGGLPFDLSLPTEPLIMLIMLLVLLKMFQGGFFSREIVYHPVSLALYCYLIWLLITTITSSMPVVSIKFFLVRLWFIVVFYFLAVKIFRRHGNIRIFLWCYTIALMLVIFYSLYRHSAYGFFSHSAAHYVVRPFYNDHTAYGAALAMFFPVILLFAFTGKGSPVVRRATWFVLLVFTTAIVFSYTRAAWLSLGAAFGVWVIIMLKIRFVTLMTFLLVFISLILVLRNDIIRELEKNRQDSSENFTEHLQSMTNISSDASNVERINRWKSALGMFSERPFFGWGPGTYMFQYAPFQLSYDRTIISTNHADGGDAHSEYLGPLSETGLPGLISILLFMSLTVITGFRLLNSLSRKKDRILAMGILLGLITYIVHGTLNNFLHTDKGAVPYWGFTAILVAMDLYRRKTKIVDHPAKGQQV
jgi:putative inorganic carbon (hco3(-)) transporter